LHNLLINRNENKDLDKNGNSINKNGYRKDFNNIAIIIFLKVFIRIYLIFTPKINKCYIKGLKGLDLLEKGDLGPLLSDIAAFHPYPAPVPAAYPAQKYPTYFSALSILIK